MSQFEFVRTLAGTGASHGQIAAATGVPRSTVQRWLGRERAPREDAVRTAAAWAPTPAPAYAYLLGMYLGDGHIDYPRPKTWTLKVSCDPQYPSIIDELTAAISSVFDDRRRHGDSSPMPPASSWPSPIPRSGARFHSTALGESTTGRSRSRTGSWRSRERIRSISCAD